jgi:hypothetical protein
LLVVLLVFSIFVISLAMAVPRWKTEIQRDRENMEIDRAHQYVEGIKRYYHKFGSYPPNLERLKETNGIHYLRREWPDPLTPDGKWKLLQYSDLKNGEVVGGGLGLPGGNGVNGSTQGNGTTSSSSTSGSLFGGGLGGGLGMSGGLSSMGNTNPGGGLFSNSDDGDSGTNNSSSGSTTAAGSATSAGGSTSGSSTAGSGTSDSSSASGSKGGLFGGSSGATSGHVFGGSGIVGVASKSKRPAVHAFNRKHRPDQWQFVYNPMKDRSLLGPGVGNGPALGQQIGTQPGSSTSGSQGGLFGSGTSGTTSNSGGSGSSSNPGAGLFGDSGSN